MFVLAGVVLLQVAAKVILFTRVARLLDQTKVLLRLVDAHAKITDRQRSGVQDAISSLHHETASVRTEVERVPEKTVEKLKGDGPASGFVRPGQGGPR